MNEHRFILQPYRSPASRFRCPNCRHSRRTFTRYINLETDSYLAGHVGRCDREEKCGYHYTPRQYFAENPHETQGGRVKVGDSMPLNNRFNHLPAYLVKGSRVQKSYACNNFILFLADIFGWESALQAAERYNIGTSKHWRGATVFWQVDAKGHIRTGKIMLYDKSTGKRVKQPFNHIAWVHKLLMRNAECQMRNEPENTTSAIDIPTSEFKLKQCFFGEHLLCKNPVAAVGITESEKTAVMASVMMPELVWLAAGSLHGLTEEKCLVLKNRRVLLFPDTGAYDYWLQCARTLNLKIPAATFAVHDEMEKTATPEERAAGADMADRWCAEWQEITQQSLLKH